MKTIKQKINEMRLKYKDGRKCPVCNILWEIEAFHFSDDKPYNGQCNDCNKLITLVANNHRKQKKDKTYCIKRIKAGEFQIKLAQLILKFPDASDVKLAKIIRAENIL